MMSKDLSPLRVLLVSGVYPPEIGGPSRQTREIAEALLASGIHVEVITSTPDPGASEEDASFAVHRLGSRSRQGRLSRIWGMAVWLVAVRNAVRAAKPDVVHIQSVSAFSFYCALAARSCGIRVLTKYAGSAVSDVADTQWYMPGTSLEVPARRSLSARARLAKFRERACLRMSTVVWITTPTFQQRLTTSFAIPNEKLWLYPNAIDLRPFVRIREQRADEPLRPVRVGVVARLKPLKGIHIAVEALPQMLEQLDTSVRLSLYGDGSPEYIESLRQLVVELGVGESVEFFGAIPPDKVADVYANVDVLVVPSFEEAFGIVIIEAMAAGVPVVASRVGGIPDVIDDGHTGLLVSAGDPSALASAVVQLVRDADQTRSRTAEAAIRAERYDLGRALPYLIDQYRFVAEMALTPSFENG